MPAKTEQPDYAAMDAADSCAPGYHKMVAERSAAAKFLTNWKVDNATPFDTADDILRQILGLTNVLEHAHLDADDLDRAKTDASMMHGAYPVFMARALEAIGTLTALAIFLGEAA